MRFIVLAGISMVMVVNALTACSIDRLLCSKPVEFVGVGVPGEFPVSPPTMWVGDSVSMTASAGLDPSEEFCPQNEVMYTSATNPDRFEWMSSDTTIVSVDEAGRVVARGVGTATVTARSAGVVSRYPYGLRVAPPLTRVTFSADPPVGTVGSSTTVRANAFGANGEPVEEPALTPLSLTSPTGVTLSWSSGSSSGIEGSFTPAEKGEYFIRTAVLRSFKPSWTIQLQYVVK